MDLGGLIFRPEAVVLLATSPLRVAETGRLLSFAALLDISSSDLPDLLA